MIQRLSLTRLMVSASTAFSTVTPVEGVRCERRADCPTGLSRVEGAVLRLIYGRS